jgi:hypothetical protein
MAKKSAEDTLDAYLKRLHLKDPEHVKAALLIAANAWPDDTRCLQLIIATAPRIENVSQ